ncbi:unnamed protein product [Rotaria socialis]|uniref:Uncharacterized protein n=1 Tax=Rotaria socialis TaxID=392032 RepID=A0A818XRE2_9BILA|nr:unnamed protein product [Rotaria socialis]
MKVVTPFELNTIKYRDKYTFEQIKSRPNNWWHPINNFNQQREWRKCQILNLLVQFEILNVQVKSSSRRQRRNRFLRLATNRSDSLTASLLILADHAFKMSRKPIIKNKTTIHVKLEKAIDYNTQMIRRLVKNGNSVPDKM